MRGKLVELAMKQMIYAEEVAKNMTGHVYAIDSLRLFDLKAEIERMAMDIDGNLETMWRRACG